MVEVKALAFEAIECCQCHCHFCVTVEHKRDLLNSKEGFYCPNGHEQFFTGISNEQKIKELKQKIVSCGTEKSRLIQELDKTEKTAKAYKMLYCRERKKLV